MIEDTEPTQLEDITMGGTHVTLGDEDIMIDIRSFYSDNPNDGHKEFLTENMDNGP